MRIMARPKPQEDATQAQRLYELSLGLARTPVSRNVEMLYTLYDSQGVEVSSTVKANKLKIAHSMGMSGRDLRTIDLPSGGVPHIPVRERAILIHMFDLRLLIQADQTLLVHLDETVNHKQDIVRNNTSRVFCHNLEGKLRRDYGPGVWGSLPYELRVLEIALSSVTSTLEAEYLLANEQAANVMLMQDMQILDKSESEIYSELRKLLDLLRRLSDIEQRARYVRSAVKDVLNEDQDMADMHLTDKRAGKPHAAQDHQDVEYLLEAYYKSSDTVVQEAGSLLGNVQKTEETVRSILDIRRNQIMVFETRIEIIMLGLAAATLVSGAYGMNVINYLEESRTAFGCLVSLCLIVTVLISRYGFRQLRHIQRMQY